MKKLTVLLVSLFMAMPVAAQKKTPVMKVYDWEIIRIIDGDTVEFAADWVPDPIKKKISIRVYGVDTPEKGHRAQCEKEALAGAAASEFTKKAVADAKRHQVALIGWDKYGGRVLGDVLLDGKSLREMLISRGFAREYYGEAKTSWCK